MSDATLLLTTGSGAVFGYAGPDGSGLYIPLAIWYNGMKLVSSGIWVETHPDGFQIFYGLIEPDVQSTYYVPCGSIKYVPCGEPLSSSSSSSSSSGSSGQCVPIQLGLQRNLIPLSFVAPNVGVGVNDRSNEGEGGQPRLCTADEDLGDPAYSADNFNTAMDRAVGLARNLVHGYVLLDRNSGSSLGNNAAASCQVNLSSGNVVVSLKLPSAGTADPPLRFYYNSLSNDVSEYGYGWTNLYRAQIVQMPTHPSGILLSYQMKNAAGATWAISRNLLTAAVTYIEDPFGRQTQFFYDGLGHLSSVVDANSRSTNFTVDGAGNLVAVQLPDGHSVQMVYDGHLLREWINPENDIMTFTYDACNQLRSIITPEGNTLSFRIRIYLRASWSMPP